VNTAIIAHREHPVSDIERMAHAFTASRLFGVSTVEQAIALCLIAQAEGRHPASAAQDYHIIQGRPAKKADAMLRDFLAAGGKVEWHKLDDTIADATFSHAAGGSVRITWDMPRAKKAQLTTPMWSKYPRQMLRARVVSEGVRTVFPMATSGMYVPEEVQEFEPPKEPAQLVTVDGEIVEPKSKRLSRDDYKALSDKIKACATIADLVELWTQRETQEAIAGLPNDWREMIVAEKDERKSELATIDAKPFDPEAFVTNLYAEMEDAHSADQVDEIWTAQNVESALAEHADALAEAESIRGSRLNVLAQPEDDFPGDTPR
jgi:hypothetical protein